MGDFQHKVAIVTGAGSGIGLATAIQLGREGASVVLVGRSIETLQQAKLQLINAGSSNILELALDVRRDTDMQRMADETVSRFGCIDILVAAAGTLGSVSKEMKLPYALAHLPLEDWDTIIDTNLKGLIHSNRAVLKQMLIQHSGDVVNVGSYPGSVRGSAHAAAYTASKFAVRGLTQAAALEMRPFGIRMQTVMPGPTATPMLYGTNSIAKSGVLTAETVARQIIHMLSLPVDATLSESVLYAEKSAAKE